MMKVEKIVGANGELLFAVSGRLDTNTAPDFDKAVSDGIEGVRKVIVDMSELEYISSAGLRVLLSLHKKVSANGTLVIRNANEIVSEVFEVTGFADILNIE